MTLLGGAVEQHHYTAPVKTAAVDVDAIPRTVVAEFSSRDGLIALSLIHI